MIQTAQLVTTLFLIASGIGCHRSQPNSGLTTTQMQIGSRTFTLEIANTEAARQRGLMKRDSMASDHGMIFVFDEDKHTGFWMKNTRIPLDIIFVDARGLVVGIKQMKPYDLNPTNSPKPYRWAIELNKGIAEEAGVKVGDQLAIPEAAKKVGD